MSNPIYDQVCQQHGYDPIQRRAARVAAARIIGGVTDFFRDLFGLSGAKKRSDVALAR